MPVEAQEKVVGRTKLADQVAESETLTQIARQIAGAGSDRGAAFDLHQRRTRMDSCCGIRRQVGAALGLIKVLPERGETVRLPLTSPHDDVHATSRNYTCTE